MKYLIALHLIIFLAACGVNDGHYKNVDEFRSEILSWGIKDKNINFAIEKASNKGFSCQDYWCYKDLPGFPCNQRLRMTFEVNLENKVKDISVWEIRGKLPQQCL